MNNMYFEELYSDGSGDDSDDLGYPRGYTEDHNYFESNRYAMRVARKLLINWLPIPRDPARDVFEPTVRNLQTNLVLKTGQLIRGDLDEGDYEDDMNIRVGLKFIDRSSPTPFPFLSALLPSWRAFANALRECTTEKEYTCVLCSIT